MSNNNSDVKLALDEMRFVMQQTLNNGDALDQKVNTLLVAAGIVLALTSTLQITLAPNRSCLYWYVLIFNLILYFVAVAAILISSKPYLYHYAISAKWEEIDKYLFNVPEREAILSLLSGYVDQIQYNERINRRKAKLQSFSLILLVVTVTIFIILAAIP